MPLQTELVDWLMRVEAKYREMPGLQAGSFQDLELMAQRQDLKLQGRPGTE